MAERYQRTGVPGRNTPNVDYAGAGVQGELTQLLQSFTRVADKAGTKLGERTASKEMAGVEGTPKLKSNLTSFGRAYNNAAIRNYGIQAYSDIEQTIGKLEAESQGDPNKLKFLSDEVRKEVVKNALPEARGDVLTMFNRRLSEGVVRTTRQQIDNQRASNKAYLQQGLDTVTDAISRKLTSGDPALMAEAEEDELHYSVLIDGAVASGDLTMAEAVALKADGAKRVTTQVVLGQFERSIDEGDPVGYISNVIDQPVDNLADSEKQQVVGEMFRRLNQRQALTRERGELDNAEAKARYAAGEKQATLDLLNGRLTVDRVEKLVAADYLDPTVARTLRNELLEGPKRSDDSAERFHVETNLLSFSEEEIRDNRKLSWDTKRELIETRRKESSGWKSTQQAREAADRIDRALGILPGVDSRLLSDEDRRARDQALTEWYDAVDSLPEEERRLKSIELSGSVIQRVIKSNASKQAQQLEQRLRSYQADKDPSKLKGSALKEYTDTVARYERQIQEARGKAQ